MNLTKTTSILRSFIIVPLVATTVSMSAFTASVTDAVNQTKAVVVEQQAPSAEELALQVEREVKAAKINAYFTKYNMPLAGSGMDMVLAAEKYGLDWRMIPAIAIRESTGGRFACKRFPENAWGWHSCKSGLGGSTETAIELIAQHLSGSHPRTARYYASKTTVRQKLQTYNPPSVVPTYADEVISLMNRIEGIKLS